MESTDSAMLITASVASVADVATDRILESEEREGSRNLFLALGTWM